MTRERKPNQQGTGYCSICKSYGRLTWDHVPPKGCCKADQMMVSGFESWIHAIAPPHRVNWIDLDGFSNARRYPRKTPDGVKFRTLCAGCNNSLLGGKYDSELKRVCDQFGRALKLHHEKRVALPRVLAVEARTHLLARSIIGHLLAADPAAVTRAEHHGRDVDLAAYFLDESRSLPDSVEIYYWPYPTGYNVILRHLALVVSEPDTAGTIGELLKFFPVAFMVADRTFPGRQLELPLPSILGDGCNDLECRVQLRFDLSSIPPSIWPEAPDEYHQILASPNLAVFSKARPPRRNTPRRTS